MRFQTVMGAGFAEKVFRSVQNCYTKTATASSLPIGAAVFLATHSASVNGQFAQAPATSTSVTNNLFLGIAHATIQPEDVGLVQCYGYDDDAIVQLITADQTAGELMIPSSLTGPMLIQGGSIVTCSAATGTAANNNVVGLGGLVMLAASVASSSATSTATAKVFIRAL